MVQSLYLYEFFTKLQQQFYVDMYNHFFSKQKLILFHNFAFFNFFSFIFGFINVIFFLGKLINLFNVHIFEMKYANFTEMIFNWFYVPRWTKETEKIRVLKISSVLSMGSYWIERWSCLIVCISNEIMESDMRCVLQSFVYNIFFKFDTNSYIVIGIKEKHVFICIINGYVTERNISFVEKCTFV